ncbi:Nucleotide-binding universal stress protein, UspA family [Flavobacterium swingsii]|jgi:nucleotide-binding universal stress UspA family protein|uniref:Nucleotide-binding universal stress protein, UspA family n=1 Tax=Flavobacterium swingsii TaxID=498292 RepID=A0A1I0YNF6_9FLAO|nr:universal stress protein [Flavobacterium swingsii]SFB14864.1 Nucleotide-binding universal stress protein, UspA family [Flavobacterium swingsii]
MKRILVPTDFSENAEHALKVAAQIARDTNGEIFLVHMLEIPSQMADAVSGGAAIPEIAFFINKAHEKLEEVLTRDYLEGINVSEAVKLESAFEGIIKSSKKHDIDLVVMGSHGTSGFQELLIGSTTEKIVRTSEAPVLVIKHDTNNFKTDRFVFASDFSKEVKKPFEKIIAFANVFGSHLDLVMINTPNSFKTSHAAQKIMKEFVSDFSITNYSLHIYNDANIETGVLNFASSVNADLIGMCTHGRTSLYHFFNGSISEGLVNHASKPVVTFKI